MGLQGMLRIPEQTSYRERSQMDFYRLGAAYMYSIDPKEVTTAQRSAFKVAFMETLWVRLFGEDRDAFITDLMCAAEMIEDGINHGDGDEAIVERISAGVDLRTRATEEAELPAHHRDREVSDGKPPWFPIGVGIGFILLIAYAYLQLFGVV